MTVDDILRTDNRDDNEDADEREKGDEIEKEDIKGQGSRVYTRTS